MTDRILDHVNDARRLASHTPAEALNAARKAAEALCWEFLPDGERTRLSESKTPPGLGRLRRGMDCLRKPRTGCATFSRKATRGLTPATRRSTLIGAMCKANDLNDLNDLGALEIAMADLLSLPTFTTALNEGPSLLGFFN